MRTGPTLVRGVSGELEDENWRLCSTTLVRGVSGELEDENWRLCSTTLVRGVICGAGSWELVTLQCNFSTRMSHLSRLSGSWKMRTGNFLVQL